MKYLVCLTIFMLILVFTVWGKIDPKTASGIWLFDEGKGDIAADSSGNNHEGKITGAKWEKGKFGNGIIFDKTGEVRILSTEKLQLSDEFTFMAFFNTQALDDWHQIIAKDGEYLLRIDPPGEGTRMSAFVNLGGWEPRASAFVPDKNTWYHFAAVFNVKVKDALQLKVYVNGEQKGQSTRAGKPAPGAAAVTIGHWNNGSRFKGVIDDVGIFKAALEVEDIMAIATNGLKATVLAGQSVDTADKMAVTWGSLKK